MPAKLVTVPEDTFIQGETPKAKIVSIPEDTPFASDETTAGKLKLEGLTKGIPETAGSKYQSPSLADRFRYYVGGLITKSLPAIGGTVGGMVSTPETLGLGTIPGAAAGAGLGSTISEELKNEFPKLFGSRAKDIPELLGNIGTDAVVQGAIPEGIGQGISLGLKGIAAKLIGNKLTEATSPALKAGLKYGKDVEDAGTAASLARGNRDVNVASAVNSAEKARDQFVNAGKTVEQQTAKAAGFTTDPIGVIKNAANNVSELDPLQEAVRNNLKSKFLSNPIEDQLRLIKETPGDAPQQIMLNKLHKDILSDPANFHNYILATGDAKGAEQLALNDVVRKGYGQGTNTIDPGKILDALAADKNNIYKEGISGESKKNLTKFLTEVQSQKEVSSVAEQGLKEELSAGAKAAKEGDASVTAADKALEKAKNNKPDSVISWKRGRLLLAIPVASAAGSLISPEAGHALAGISGAVTGGIILKEAMIAKLMQDPQIAALTTKALKVGLTAPEAKPLTKVLVNALRGSQTLFKATNDPDAKEEAATIDQNGQLQYAKPSSQ